MGEINYKGSAWEDTLAETITLPPITLENLKETEQHLEDLVLTLDNDVRKWYGRAWLDYKEKHDEWDEEVERYRLTRWKFLHRNPFQDQPKRPDFRVDTFPTYKKLAQLYLAIDEFKDTHMEIFGKETVWENGGPHYPDYQLTRLERSKLEFRWGSKVVDRKYENKYNTSRFWHDYKLPQELEPLVRASLFWVPTIEEKERTTK